MHTRIDGQKLLITLDLAIAFDEKTGGYTISERDGPPEINHQIVWGPMPWHLLGPFMQERAEYIRATSNRMLAQMLTPE